jgi:hypothetical protein
VRYTCPLEAGSLQLEGVLSRSWRHLANYLPEHRDSLEWLRSVEVMATSHQFGEFTVGAYEGKFPLPSLAPTPQGRVCYLTRRGQEALSKEDAAMFAEWAEATGFPVDKKDLISNTIILIQESPEPVEEPEDVTEAEEYGSTVETLHRMYGGCQICTQVTPANEGGYETRETLKSVISEKRGLYQGRRGKYEVANSLYLCPTHQALAERGLMRFKQVPRDWANRKPEVIENLDALAQQSGGMPEDSPYPLTVQVFAWTAGQLPGWNDENMVIKSGHAKALFQRLKKYVEQS